MKFCDQCGHELIPGDAFCVACGTQVPDPAPAVAGPPQRRRRLLPFAVGGVAVVAVGAAVVAYLLTGDDGSEAGTPSSGGAAAGLTPGRSPSAAQSSPAAVGTAATRAAGGTPAGGSTSAPGGTAPSPAASVPTTAPASPTAPASVPAAPTATAVPPTAAPTEVPTPVPAAPNLIANGGFESGLVAPWGTGIYEPRPQGIFWGSADAEAAVVSGGRTGGSHLRIENRSAAAPNVYRTLSQKVAVQGGTPHCFTAWVRTENGSPGMLSFRLNDSWSQAIGIGGGAPDWRQYAYTFTTEDGNIDVRIVSENTGIAHVDDLVLTSGACKVANGAVPAGTAPR